MSGSSPSRPPKASEPAVRNLARRIFAVCGPAARGCGYAVAQHGSMVRDLDLVAVPWTEAATDDITLVKALQAAITDHVGDCYRSADVEEKPHGRRAWTLYFQGAVETRRGAFPFIDLSVLPRAS